MEIQSTVFDSLSVTRYDPTNSALHIEKQQQLLEQNQQIM